MENIDTHNNARTALGLLSELSEQSGEFGAGNDERIATMMAALDAIIVRMPGDPDDELLDEFERIVTTLHTAGELHEAGNSSGASQSLAMAHRRIERLLQTLDEE